MKTALGRAALSGGNRVRGIDDDVQLPPVSPAVVIGLGGSGIQTITRLKSAIDAERPDQTATASINLLGIDAVDVDGQLPPLPAGTGLSVGEFFNLVANPFDASRYIHGQLPTDSYLQQWWDPEYRPPMGPLTDGLKRERMLGRLAYHRMRQQLVDRIQTSMSDAIRLTPGQAAPGHVPTVPVYIACSSSGGTGSSGFLEVVFACWRAALSAGYHPEIRAFVYLPSVFRKVVVASPQGGTAQQAQDANAYAFFRELDHFARKSSDLARYFGVPEEVGGPEIPDGDLVKQVYVIDNVLRGLGEIDSVTDMYEIVAEAMYHFLLTDVGQPLVGQNATNTDRALAELDAFKKPRRYCGLGIARVVFPGDTLRNHLMMRYIDWYLRDALLPRPLDLPQIVRDHDVVEQLSQKLETLDARARSVDIDDDIADFLDIAEQGVDQMERVPDPAQSADLIKRVTRGSPRVVRAIEELAQTRNRVILADLEDAIEGMVFSSGHGISFAREAMKHIGKRASTLHAGSKGESEIAASGAVEAEARVDKLQKELVSIAHRGLFPELVATIGAKFGHGRNREAVARELGQTIQAWAQAIYDGQIAVMREDALAQISERISLMTFELDRATERLQALAKDATVRWESDTLIGKDAGPVATTELIPADIQPEVEASSIAVSMFDDIVKEHGDALSGEELTNFIRRWSTEHSNRAFFSLGSENESERVAAENSLVDALARDGAERALMTGAGGEQHPRLPADLRDASVTNPDRLDQALQKIVKQSRTVCWSWEEGRFKVDSTDDGTAAQHVAPTVTTVIARSAALAKQVDEMHGGEASSVPMPDSERIVALSCEWAVPMHALHRVAMWKSRYDQFYRQRAHAPGGVPPNHIDKRFHEELASLVPQYFQSDDIGEVLGKALVFGHLMTAGNATILAAYDSTRANPAVQPFRRDEDGFSGRIVRITDGRLASDAEDIDLGTTWQDAFKKLGASAPLRTFIDELGTWMSRNLGAGAVDEAVTAYITEQLTPLLAALTRKPKEQAVLGHVFDGLGNWQVQLKEMAATGGA